MKTNPEIKPGQKWVHKRVNSWWLVVKDTKTYKEFKWASVQTSDGNEVELGRENILTNYNLDETHNVKTILAYYE